MKKIIMPTTQDVIHAFLKLPPKQQEEVREFVNSTCNEANFLVQAFDADYVREENYSQEDQTVLDQCQEDARKGINTSGPFKGKEAIDFLTELEKQSHH